MFGVHVPTFALMRFFGRERGCELWDSTISTSSSSVSTSASTSSSSRISDSEEVEMAISQVTGKQSPGNNNTG